MGTALKNFSFGKDKWLVVYAFLAIFQPPFLPVPFIYVLGVYTFVWLYFNALNRKEYTLLRESRITGLYKVFIFFLVYIFVFGTIDMVLIETANTLSTRLRSINQLVVLPLFQFSFIWYMLIRFNRKNYGLKDIFTVLILAGLLQCLFALSAFFVPWLRGLYMVFGDRNLYENAFFISRRGYGFSINLIDTFGYGMGLLAGYMLFIRWTKSRLVYYGAILLMLFTIAVNARTGFVVFAIAIFVKMVTGKKFLRLFLTVASVVLVVLMVKSSIPTVLEMGRRSDNDTISWISGSFSDMYMLLSADGANSMAVDEVGFLDHFIELPKNAFEFIFGTGHHVYDTQASLGFRTDIGYYNLFWEFGLIGSAAILMCVLWFVARPFFLSSELVVRRVALFNFLSYAVVLMKAILIGYNPGVFVNYAATFSLYYCLYIKRSKITSNDVAHTRTVDSCAGI